MQLFLCGRISDLSWVSEKPLFKFKYKYNVGYND
jgi:hypothetical protein